MRPTNPGFEAARLPPHSPEAEQGVLGCCLLSPAECVPACVERIQAGEDAFYDLRHREIYQAMVEVAEAQKPIDLITLQQALKDRKRLAEVGGIGYLSTLQDGVPTAANLAYYLDILDEKAVLRRAIRICTEAVSRAFEHEGEIDALVDRLETEILKVRGQRGRNNSRAMLPLVRASIARVEAMHQNQGGLTGLASGFSDLDQMTCGFHPGEMIVIAGRPGTGKTALAMNIAEHAALALGLPVGIFSLEMTGDSLVMRLLCSRARVQIRRAKEGFLGEADFLKLTTAAGQLASAPLWIDDSSGLSILELRAKARRMAQEHGIKLLVVDYLQLLHSTSRRVENRQQEIADISSGLKGLSKELSIPVIAVSQLNRESEREGGRAPRLSQLRESGSQEQDADFVGLLYRPGKEEPENEPQSAEARAVNLLVAKQRNGPTGLVPLIFLPGLVRFESAAKVEAEDQPRLPYNDG